jgi:hypothetical protein
VTGLAGDRFWLGWDARARRREALQAVRALRVTPLARARLVAGAAGWVEAVFARTLSLQLGSPAPGGWLSLHGPGPVPSPFGIACDALPPARPGAPVRVEATSDGLALRLPAARVMLAGAALADTAVPARAPVPAPDTRRPARAGAARPLARALARQAGPACRALTAATRAHDAPACVRAACRLLGLGPGLTPAGDDLVTGWVVALQALGGRPGRTLVGRIAGPLATAAAARTTALARALLVAALAGHVAEPVRAFVACPDPARVAAVLAIGASSGADFLAGYGLAAHALGAPAAR